MPRVLIEFPHGLGDAVQLSIVLRHLAAARPDWSIDVHCRRGKETALAHLVRTVYCDDDPRPPHAAYDAVHDLGWWEGERLYGPGVAASKAVRCLADDFGLPVQPQLCRYSIEPTAQAIGKARDWLARHCGAPGPTGRYPAFVLHYEGNTACERKNLTHETARLLCDWALAAGLAPVVLDWDSRSPLPDDRRIFCPRPGPGDIWGEFGSGDAGVLAALIEASTLFCGVDSGPLHVAAATSTPAVAVWTGHNPLQFFDPAPNVLHVLPSNWQALGLLGQPQGWETAAAIFRLDVGDYVYPSPAHRFQQGAARSIIKALEAVSGRRAPSQPAAPAEGLVRVGDWWLHDDNVEQDLVVVADVYESDAYRLRLLPGILAEARLVLDIGAHVGCFARYVHERNPSARIVCVEACAENLPALRANVGEFAEVVHAACTYETGEVGLLNAVRPQCESTGGSTVRPVEALEGGPQQTGYVYWHDRRPLRKVTLHELLADYGRGERRIDLLKLDCEESEFSILPGAADLLPAVRMIVGEYHGEQAWHALREKLFPASAWDYGLMFSDGGGYTGLFHLANKHWQPPHDRPQVSTPSGWDFARPKVRGDNVLRIALPAGIGDCVWPLLKVPDLLARTGAGRAEIAFCGGPPHRSQEFLERFDFVYRAYPCDLSVVEESNPILPSGGYNWTPSGQGWHGRFDYVLVANAHLERGERIETWLPELATDWQLPRRWLYTAAEIAAAAERRQEIGRYVACYLGPTQGNTTAGHNRGPRWSPADWLQFWAGLPADVAVVLVGAAWDRDYFEQHVQPLLPQRQGRFFLDLIGRTSIAETFAAIQLAQAFVGYQSGLVVWSALLGVPTVGFWRAAGDSIEADRYLSFAEAMATCWTPPGAVESGRYLGAIYGRTQPADLSNWGETNGWW